MVKVDGKVSAALVGDVTSCDNNISNIISDRNARCVSRLSRRLSHLFWTPVITRANATNHRLAFADFHLPQFEMRVSALDEAKSEESDMDRFIQVKIYWADVWFSEREFNGGTICLSGVSIRRARRRSRPRRGRGARRSSSVPSWVLPSQISWLNVTWSRRFARHREIRQSSTHSFDYLRPFI